MSDPAHRLLNSLADKAGEKLAPYVENDGSYSVMVSVDATGDIQIASTGQMRATGEPEDPPVPLVHR